MTQLIDLKSPKGRFARSINVERDTGTGAIDSYLPVGRAIDAISRVGRALTDDQVETAFSITGPYGSGKSSLAVMLDALCSPSSSPSYKAAESLFSDVSPVALEQIKEARIHFGAHKSGFIRAVITAQREPIAATVLRALLRGAEAFGPPVKGKTTHQNTVAKTKKMLKSYKEKEGARPEAREIKAAVAAFAQTAPVLLLIDEFGKNLEAFADSHSDADLYLLQELAEATRGGDRIPLVLITLQHMAFDEYAASAKAGQRREWAKIQGRFEDIPFVDSAAQTRSLIAAAFNKPSKELAPALSLWAGEQSQQLASLGLNDLAQETNQIANCWPLHPIALAILPELCERYGQNERTLFSFLASSEPGSVATYLRETLWEPKEDLPVVRLDKIYDYFLESASNLVGVSDAASRWVEIDVRIRDAHGLEEPQRRVLKTVGLLNLISVGGSIRASKPLLQAVCADNQTGTKDAAQVAKCLKQIEKKGLITYRDYADEYRVWSGSDFDLKASIEIARRRVSDYSPSALLNSILEMGPLVAARHSHKTGTLRSFSRKWIATDISSIQPLGITDKEDGLALYVLGTEAPYKAIERHDGSKPVAFVTNASPGPLIAAATEVAAIDEILEDPVLLGDDWVARRELIERKAEARVELEQIAEDLYGTTSKSRGPWAYLNKSQKQRRLVSLDEATASQAMSRIADDWYDKALIVRNDLVNRHDLSGQLSKARRMLLEGMINTPDEEQLGLTGHGPEVTLYRSTLDQFTMHQKSDEGWALQPPPDSAKKGSASPIWERLIDLLSSSTSTRAPVNEIYAQLAAPPFGLRSGIAPIFFMAALIIHADEIALYEHGTFKPRFDDALVERLLRNPQNFAIKHFASRTGARSLFLTTASEHLNLPTGRIRKNQRVGGVLTVISNLLSTVTTIPTHIQKTKRLSKETLAIRKVLLSATEPDELLFSALPQILGYKTIAARSKYEKEDIDSLSQSLAEAMTELRFAYPSLLDSIRTELSKALHAPLDGLQTHLSSRAIALGDQILDPRAKRLIVALRADLDEEGWVEYVAMNVSGGTDPKNWTDEDRDRFSTELKDLAGTFLRIEWLNADLRTRSDGFSALRIAVTHPSGEEHVSVVTIGNEEQQKIETILQKALTEAEEQGLDSSVARDALLAILANRSDTVGSVPTISPADTRSTSVESTKSTTAAEND